MSKPSVFIVESLRPSDEEGRLFEGRIISRVLRFSDSPAKYRYIQTKKMLQRVIGEFAKSGYRYLHLSCHGGKKGISLTCDEIDLDELRAVLAGHLRNRRVFLSSCSVATQELAEALLYRTGCNSVVGPSKDIEFDRAAIFWASFYHLMLRDGARSMKRDRVRENASVLQALFGVHMRFFTRSKSAQSGFKEVRL